VATTSQIAVCGASLCYNTKRGWLWIKDLKGSGHGLYYVSNPEFPIGTKKQQNSQYTLPLDWQLSEGPASDYNLRQNPPNKKADVLYILPLLSLCNNFCHSRSQWPVIRLEGRTNTVQARYDSTAVRDCTQFRSNGQSWIYLGAAWPTFWSYASASRNICFVPFVS